MKLFQHSSGMIIAFGFDMVARKPNPRRIAWSDTDGDVTGDWEIKASNQAGFWNSRFDVDPQFIFEVNGKIVAYQPGLCIEMTYIGPPLVWSFRLMRAEDNSVLHRSAA